MGAKGQDKAGLKLPLYNVGVGAAQGSYITTSTYHVHHPCMNPCPSIHGSGRDQLVKPSHGRPVGHGRGQRERDDPTDWPPAPNKPLWLTAQVDSSNNNQQIKLCDETGSNRTLLVAPHTPTQNPLHFQLHRSEKLSKIVRNVWYNEMSLQN